METARLPRMMGHVARLLKVAFYSYRFRGSGSVMEAIASRGLVFNSTKETRNIAMHTPSRRRKIPRENATGAMGLKSTAIAKKAAAHRRLCSPIACTNTSPAAAHTMNCTATVNPEEECQKKTARTNATAEIHFMIFVNTRTSILQLRRQETRRMKLVLLSKDKTRTLFQLSYSRIIGS
jgi:hypothetical protein